MSIHTHWNGMPCQARRVHVIVADTDVFPRYWAREHIGQERAAVRVSYNGDLFYLDNEDGSGWFKVTHGGGPGYPHRELFVEREADG